LTPQAFTSSLANNHEFGTAFLLDSKFNHMVGNFTSINERLCVIRIKGSLINIHAPTSDSEEEAKDQFYQQRERTSANNRQAQPAYSTVQMKISSDWSALQQAGKWRSKGILHTQTHPPPSLALPRWTHFQPDQSLLDRRETLF
jgi:hypothetical protein